MEFMMTNLREETGSREPMASNRAHESLDLMALVREVVREYGTQIRTHTIKFRGGITSQCFIHGDRDSLKKLLLNLLANVVNSSETIHEVCISVSPDEASVMVTVEDCGCSVNRRERRSLPSLPLEKAPDMMHEADMGLALVKIIADAHRATVKMQGACGVGTAFTVKFAAQKG